MTAPFQDLGAWLMSRPESDLPERIENDGSGTKDALALADASQPTIVRAALDAALVSGDSRPRVTFGRTLDNGQPAHNTLTAQLGARDMWHVRIGDYYVAQYLTTEQAVAAIVAARNERT